MRGISAIDIVAGEVRSERAAQQALRHCGNEGRGPARVRRRDHGVVVTADRTVSASGLGAAVLSGLLALMSFWPRKYWRTDLGALRARYLAADPTFVQIGLLDSQIVMAERSYRTLAWKVRFLKLAMVSLAAAVPMSALGTAVE